MYIQTRTRIPLLIFTYIFVALKRLLGVVCVRVCVCLCLCVHTRARARTHTQLFVAIQDTCGQGTPRFLNLPHTHTHTHTQLFIFIQFFATIKWLVGVLWVVMCIFLRAHTRKRFDIDAKVCLSISLFASLSVAVPFFASVFLSASVCMYMMCACTYDVCTRTDTQPDTHTLARARTDTDTDRQTDRHTCHSLTIVNAS